MVDDAHGLGVIGEGGRGTASYYGLEDQVDIYMGTFSKSLASLGGYMAASSRVADFVRHSSRPFIFSASIPPANTAAALAALRELEAHPELVTTLQENAKYMRGLLNERNIKMRPSNGDCIPIIPIIANATSLILSSLSFHTTSGFCFLSSTAYNRSSSPAVIIRYGTSH